MTHPLSRASDTPLRFRLLRCDRCDTRTWLVNDEPAPTGACDHVWWELHTFFARSQGPGLSLVPVAGIGG